MKRIVTEPRENWEARLESLDFMIHKDYWNEQAYYQFTASEIDTLEAAANGVHELCCRLMEDHLGDIIDQYDLPLGWKHYIEHNHDFSLYGRFDFVFDKDGMPKMLEYNADTPTSLFEAAVVQWYWLQDKFPKEDQFNSIHEKLIAQWKRFRPWRDMPLFFTCFEDHAEDFITTRYIMDCAVQAKQDCVFIDLEKIGWNRKFNCFVDEEEMPIRNLFKLYPYEWMIKDEFGQHINKEQVRLIEPPWKYLWSNKTLLAMLWKYYPDHPNLLPTYLDIEEAYKHSRTIVMKPVVGREGNNITIRHLHGDTSGGFSDLETVGPYENEKLVYQTCVQRDFIDGMMPTLGIWMIGDKSCGMGIREDRSLITGNTSKFTPHLFTKE